MTTHSLIKSVQEQKHSEIGLLLGGLHYTGDLNQRFNIINYIGPGGTLFYQRNAVNDRFAWRTSLSAGRFSASDKDSKDPYLVNRNLSVRTFIAELSTQVVFNFFPYEIGGQTPGLVFPFTPYLFFGAGFFYHQPMANLDGTWYNLRDMDTEGQASIVYKRKRAWPVQFTLPMGLGIKAAFAKKMSVGVEWGIRKIYTDYIDDVSSTYAAVSVIEKERGNIAASLSDRSLSTSDANNINANVGRQRGNPNRKDWYSFLGVTISWRIDDNKGKCPSYK